MISYKVIWYFMTCLFLVSTSYSCIQSIDPLTDHNSELNEHNQYEWSPVEDYKDLSMLELLEHLSKAAIELGDYKYETSDGWIGFEPATDSLIEDAENRLEVRFPAEYVEFLKITNGFPAVNSIEPSFLPVSKIDYTKNIAPFLISLWGIEGNPDKVNGAKYER